MGCGVGSGRGAWIALGVAVCGAWWAPVAAGTLHVCRRGDATAVQGMPCAVGWQDVRRIAFEPEAAAPVRPPHAHPRVRSPQAADARRARWGTAHLTRSAPDACAVARTARERVLGRNQQGGTYAQRVAAHEQVAQACY